MEITNELTDDAVLAELGARVAQTRLERNLTQAELGRQAGIGSATVKRIEAGQAASLTSFIRVLRVLALVERWEQLVPEPLVSPIEALKLQGRQRRRASGVRVLRDPDEDRAPWAWGEEPTDGTP